MDGNTITQRVLLILLALFSAGCSCARTQARRWFATKNTDALFVLLMESMPRTIRRLRRKLWTKSSDKRRPKSSRCRHALSEPFELALADARAFALSNNLDLQVELLNPAIAAQNVPIEEGRYDALLGFSANRLHLDTPNAPSIPVPGLPPVVGLQFDSRSYEPNLTLPSRTGGSFRVSRPLAKTEDTRTPATYESDWRFSIAQPLLRGAGLACEHCSDSHRESSPHCKRTRRPAWR